MIEDLIDGLEQGWKDALAGFKTSNDYQTAREGLNAILNVTPVNYHPAMEDVFAAFRETPFDKVRVVIIGQDPYPEEANATGLAFSMRMPDPVPANDDEADLSSSIKRIYEAIKSDLGEDSPRHGNLKRWAKQGVLLLNRSLTLHVNPEENKRARKNWHAFTQAVVQALTKSKRPIQFILWGNKAQEIKLPDYPESLIHRAWHPTPRDGQKARDFINCQHFSKVNDILVAMGEEPINWIRDLTREENLNQ